MIPPAARLCVGCGQVLDELEPSDGRPSCIAAEAFHEKYRIRFTDLHWIEVVCPSRIVA